MPQMPAQRGLLSQKRTLGLLFITLMASLAVATTWAMRPMVEQQAQPELHALGAQAQHLTHQTRAAWPKPVAPPAAVAAPDAADSASAAEPDKAAEAEVHMDFTSAPPPSPKRRKPHSNTAKDAGVANNKTAKNTKNTKTQNPKARRDEPKAPAQPTPQPPDAPIALDNASKDDGEQPQTEDKVSDAKPPIAPKKADNDAQHPAQPSKESPQPSENRPLKRDEGQKEDSSDQPFMTF